MVSSLHTTTALFVNEVQSAFLDDIKTILQDWVRDDKSVETQFIRNSPTVNGTMRTHTCARSCWVIHRR